LKDLCGFFEEKFRGVERLAVLGVGSSLRADDAAGGIVIERLREKYGFSASPGLSLMFGETAPENFSGKIKAFRPTHLLVIDAAELGREPGEAVEIDPGAIGGPTFCSHMLPLKIMLDYLVRETGVSVTILGIQYKCLDFDADMTPEMEAALGEICEALGRAIDAFGIA